MTCVHDPSLHSLLDLICLPPPCSFCCRDISRFFLASKFWAYWFFFPTYLYGWYFRSFLNYYFLNEGFPDSNFKNCKLSIIIGTLNFIPFHLFISLPHTYHLPHRIYLTFLWIISFMKTRVFVRGVYSSILRAWNST